MEGRRCSVELSREGFPPLPDPELSAGALFSFYLGARVSKAVDSEIDTTGQLDQMLGLLRAISPAPVS